MKKTLPIDFQNRMKAYLGDEYSGFLESYSRRPLKGVRINTLKSDKETVLNCFENYEKSNFYDLSYVVDSDKVGNMPLHSAGAFYSQEPSASSAVAVLNPQKGDIVLDLCSAPGGKSTQIATMLCGEGLLWSNEIVKNRANILLSNIERMGIKNAVVSSCHPDLLCEKLAGFFDKILVDAPCSGEGMFRKNDEAIEEWSLAHVKMCAVRQLQILNSAAKALKENGILVYSTCTFSKEENEDVCVNFLNENPEFELISPNVNFGRKAFGIDAIRIYPMDGGEGHFVAKFKRIKPNDKSPKNYEYPTKQNSEAEKMYSEIFKDKLWGKIINIKDKLIILPQHLPDLKSLQILRAGVEFGEIKGKRIEPSHNLFTVQKAENCKNLINLSSDDINLKKFLHGEEIESPCKSYTAVAVNSVVIGFGKSSSGVMKNKYPKGLRYKSSDF